MSRTREIIFHLTTVVLIILTCARIVPNMTRGLDDTVEGYGKIARITIQETLYYDRSGKQIRRLILLYLNTGVVIRLSEPYSNLETFSDSTSIGKEITYYYVDNSTSGFVEDPLQLEVDKKVIYDNQTFLLPKILFILLTLVFAFTSVKWLIEKKDKFFSYWNWDFRR